MAVNFDIVTGATSDKNNNKILIFAVKCHLIIKLTGCHDNKCHEGKVSSPALSLRTISK